MSPQQDQNQSNDPNAYLLPTNKLKAVLQPLDEEKPTGAPASTAQTGTGGSDLAAEVIRSKIRTLYGDEPDVEAEIAAAGTVATHSKHQQFMSKLSASGQPLPEIQARWHEYYAALPDHEKHEVWREFYAVQAVANKQKQVVRRPGPSSQPQVHAPSFSRHQFEQPAPQTDRRSVADIKAQLTERVKRRSHTPAKQHFQSLIFGLATGSVVLIILLFGFFNERFVAPFITPSRNVSATPIIIDPGSTAVSKEPKVIIPKINVEIPVVYDEPSIEERAIQQALERGVVHYSTTSSPGELGNTVIFGHSSNNILNQGKYKFAFVLLSKLNTGDTFYLTKDGTRYAYKVFDKKVVSPTDFSVLEPIKGKPATATLITCDPPGTSINRLVVTAEQISPDPNANVASTGKAVANKQPKVIPGNAPSLWSRLTSWLTG